MDQEILEKSESFARKMISELSSDFCYHNLEHTEEVVEAVREIGSNSELSDGEMNLVLAAAWFHDVGYSQGCEDHEGKSKAIMQEKLKEWDVPLKEIHRIGQIIESTRMPQNPKTLLDKVICDADLYHLSTDKFIEKSELLRQEILNLGLDKEVSKKQWKKTTRDFITNHTYFTNYGQVVLEPRKVMNIKSVSKKKGSIDSKYVAKLEKELIKTKNKLDKNKIQRPDRGIETMFRITSKNHLTLSGMADNKANIMISINSIILSVLVSVLFRKFEEYPNLIIPALMLVTVCLSTIVFAVLATRPNVSSGKFTREDIMNKETNLLFFGNFHGVSLDNYLWGMKEMMKDADYLYGSMIKDIYFLGIVLGKKYKMLRKSYNVFMYGFVISIVAFIIAMLFGEHAPI